MECDQFTCYLALGLELLKVIIIGIIFVLALKSKKKTRNLQKINVKLDSNILIINLSLTISSFIFFMIVQYSTKTLIISLIQILLIVLTLIIQYVELKQNYPYSFFIRTILIVSIIIDTIINCLQLLIIIPILTTFNILTLIALSFATRLNKQRYDIIVPYLGVEIKQIQKFTEQLEKTIQEQLIKESIQSELPEQFEIERSLVKSQFSNTSKTDLRKQMFSQIIQSLQESEVINSNFIPSRFRFQQNQTYIDKKTKKEVQMYEITYEGPQVVNDNDEKEEIRTGRSLDELNLLFSRIGLKQILWETPPIQIKQILSAKINDPESTEYERNEISKFFLQKFKLLEYV